MKKKEKKKKKANAIGRLNFIHSIVYIGWAFYYLSSLGSTSTLTKQKQRKEF